MAQDSATLHLVSWNVAGLEATLRYCHTYYGGFASYIERLDCDVLAVQEVKLQRQKVQAEPAAVYAYPFQGWESYWAFPTCVGNAKGSVVKRGFNGVTTFARAGLTLAADAAPLGDPSLDGEGRCLLTDHGGFVLLNVYVHATGGRDDDDDYQRKLERKLALLAALRRKMTSLRAAGRRVVLCGDLNIASRGRDVPWKQSALPVSALQLGANDPAHPLDEAPAADGPNGWSTFGPDAVVQMAAQAAAAELRKVMGPERLTTLAATVGGCTTLNVGALLKRLHAALRGNGVGGTGGDGAETDAAREGDEGDECDAAAALAAKGSRRATSDSAAAARDTAGGSPVTMGGSVAVDEEAAAALKAVRTLTHYMGVSPSQRDCVRWLDALFSEDGMVDAFATLRPHARSRFTCWDQHKNMRYAADGRQHAQIAVRCRRQRS